MTDIFGDGGDKPVNGTGSGGGKFGAAIADDVLEGYRVRMGENGEYFREYGRARNVIGEVTEDGEVLKSWESLGKDMGEGLRKGYVDNVSQNKEKFEAPVQELILLTENELGIHSPSRVFMRIGKAMGEGLLKGYEDKVPDIKSTVRQRVRELVAAVRNEMQIKSPSKVFAKIGKYMAEGLGEGWQKGMEDIKPIITDAIPTELNGGGNAGGTKITQNIYAEKMTPSQAFQAALDAQETAAFLGFAPAYQEA